MEIQHKMCEDSLYANSLAFKELADKKKKKFSTTVCASDTCLLLIPWA